MSERIDIEAATTWLNTVPGAEIGTQLTQRWQQFATIDAPVVTIYGSYDTGKSSLLRRLLIELGQIVPSWLTVSARHETFEVNEIDAAGCLLRDTPGFVTEATDARAELNTGRASAAIALTDVAIVVVPPQLATAEYSVLRELIQQDWAPGSLWFVISRFDEAGVDPDDDLEAYQALGVRKTHELRKALDLGDTVPVHLVCQDFAQMAGAERNPDPAIWDDSRTWDGITGLVAAITDLGRSPNRAFRESAAQRFWRSSVHQTLQQLQRELTDHLDNTSVSDEGEQRRASWVSQLDTLTHAAQADLRGKISAAIGDAVDSPDPAHTFARALETSIGAWHAACGRDIDKLLRSVGDTIATDRSRPDWQRFEEMAGTLRRESPGPEAASEGELIYAPIVRQVGDAVLNALRHYDQSRGVKPSSRTAGAAGAAPGADRIAAAAAGVAMVADLAVIAEQFANRQRAADAAMRQRAQLQSELVNVGEEATELALGTLSHLADDARQRINDATADQSDLRDSLHELVQELRSTIASGKTLLAG